MITLLRDRIPAWMRSTHRRPLKLAVGGALLLVIASLTCRTPAREPLPTKVAVRLEHEMLATVNDTTEIHRLQRTAAAAGETATQLTSRAKRSEQVADRAGDNADSVARSAAIARTVMDSAVVWQGAYTLRSAQLIALTEASALKDEALANAGVRAVALDSALTRSEFRAIRADSVIRLLVPVAESRAAPCKVLGLVACPSRTAVAGGSAVLTLLVVGALHR